MQGDNCMPNNALQQDPFPMHLNKWVAGIQNQSNDSDIEVPVNPWMEIFWDWRMTMIQTHMKTRLHYMNAS